MDLSKLEKSTLSFFLEGSSGHTGHGGLALNRQNPLELGGGGWRESGAERARTPPGSPEHHGRGAVRTRASPNSSPLAMQPVSQVVQKDHQTAHPLRSRRSSASLRVVQQPHLTAAASRRGSSLALPHSHWSLTGWSPLYLKAESAQTLSAGSQGFRQTQPSFLGLRKDHISILS